MFTIISILLYIYMNNNIPGTLASIEAIAFYISAIGSVIEGLLVIFYIIIKRYAKSHGFKIDFITYLYRIAKALRSYLNN